MGHTFDSCHQIHMRLHKSIPTFHVVAAYYDLKSTNDI